MVATMMQRFNKNDARCLSRVSQLVKFEPFGSLDKNSSVTGLKILIAGCFFFVDHQLYNILHPIPAFAFILVFYTHTKSKFDHFLIPCFINYGN